MRATASAQEISAQLEEIARRLDVPPSLYEEAQERYEAVCRWLAEDDALLSYDPAMYAQGSFALGTVTRPPGDLHYDVDAVCVLQSSSSAITQKELKRLVGDRLKAHETYARMLRPPTGGRRCWTLDYAESASFHLDILPAIPDDQSALIAGGVSEEFAKHAILITDALSWDHGLEWPRSNPKGYAEWFKTRMKVRLDELRKSAAATRHDASIESVPDYAVRTPLQQMVQLFKRHRDVAFQDDADRPISIIITTLAAWAYSNEADLSEAISNAVPRMRRAINSSNGEYWVASPVNPHENFADKWKETPRKAELFHMWLDDLEREHESLLENTLMEKRADALNKSFGIRLPDAPPARSRGFSLGLVPASQPTALRFDVPHRETPQWPVHDQNQVVLRATATRDGFRNRSVRNGDVLGRGWSIDFEVSSNAPMGAQYYWQVVNTGREATEAHGLRGELVKGERTQHESSLYAGTHWVEVFVVHGGVCVGRSGEFVVVIG